ncbi:MAG TPA: tRNA (adenosine(37)-N6)-threonylcarbamoyltransferase complex dimerization subunit type 1 TsaB [Syntrophobacteria bacterium]|nr:tRNA (adenosine(37)-N6)-threonylcarbamoyltransferase complex dimerization subunit type 1 TsaB [Syntrophobacteria bacterium]
MKILAVDTSTSLGSVALVDGPNVRGELSLNVSATHNQRLLTGIHRMLTDVGWTLQDLDGLAIGLGPGSFTGLRIGMSVMKGLAFATAKPLTGVPTLDALAANVSLAPWGICPVLDARKGELYTALYQGSATRDLERITPYLVVKPQRLVELINERTVLLGDGLIRYGDYLAAELRDRMVRAPSHLNAIHGTSIAWLAMARLQRGLTENLAACAPLYVRPSEAEIKRMNR